jgi:hypothetical protein
MGRSGFVSKLIYGSLESLEPVRRVLDEAGKGLNDAGRSIKTSDIPEVLGAAAGGAVGVAAGLGILYGAGTVGFSAAGITSGLAAAGSVVGGGMVAGIFVTAAPVAVLAVGGYAVVSHRRKRKLKEAKEALLQEAIRKQNAIIKELKSKLDLAEERAEYLNSLNILLQDIIKNLRSDLNLEQPA